jgi:hypothetical protein
MSELEDDAISADLHQAISDAVGRNGGGMVTKWVAMIEVIEPDGSTVLWTQVSDGVKSWDVEGMLSFGHTLQQAKTFRDAIGGDD